MIYNLVEQYADIVSEYEVFDFRRYGAARSLVAGITLVDGSILHIRDYLFAHGQRIHGQGADMDDILPVHRSKLGGQHRGHGYHLTGERGKLYFVGCCVPMNVHHSAYVACLQSFVQEVAGQHNAVMFLDHR